jgi:hypothetical protein
MWLSTRRHVCLSVNPGPALCSFPALVSNIADIYGGSLALHPGSDKLYKLGSCSIRNTVVNVFVVIYHHVPSGAKA